MNISFFLTTRQFRAREKTVTRRLGWRDLQPGTVLMGVYKGQGLRKGEKVEKLGPIRVVDICRERLDNIVNRPSDCAKEGFPELTPWQFVEMFCREMGCTPRTIITRIEFEYL